MRSELFVGRLNLSLDVSNSSLILCSSSLADCTSSFADCNSSFAASCCSLRIASTLGWRPVPASSERSVVRRASPAFLLIQSRVQSPVRQSLAAADRPIRRLRTKQKAAFSRRAYLDGNYFHMDPSVAAIGLDPQTLCPNRAFLVARLSECPT